MNTPAVEPWLECVPNFSEGNRPEVMEALADAAAQNGVKVLGTSSDPDHNRSVLTFAGPAVRVVRAAVAAARVAVAAIDMRVQRGIHPRMGAVDVIPLIPLAPATMEDAAAAAAELGRSLSEELGLPVYLYAQSATTPAHRRLADVRRGEFEGLTQKMLQDPPDFGLPAPHPSAGAVAVGARGPLIAFNVYLATEDVAVAREVARRVRGSSGGLVGVQALGLDTVHQGMVQVSMNLVDYPATTLPAVMEMVRREAAQLGVLVARSELVGLMPAQALLDTARYYLQLPRLQADEVLEWTLQRGE